MDPSYNSMTVVGRLTGDPTTRSLPDGRLAASSSVAVHRLCRGPEGAPATATDFFRMAIYGRLAEPFSNICRKGDLVLLHGRMITRRGVAPDGEPRLYHSLVASSFERFSRRPKQPQATSPAGFAGRLGEAAPGILVPESRPPTGIRRRYEPLVLPAAGVAQPPASPALPPPAPPSAPSAPPAGSAVDSPAPAPPLAKPRRFDRKRILHPSSG
jgi:single stranded DNA-binding protein